MLAFIEPGFWQLMILLAIAMLFFGGKRIPELARGLGKGISEFKKGMNEDTTPAIPPAEETKKLPESTQKQG